MVEQTPTRAGLETEQREPTVDRAALVEPLLHAQQEKRRPPQSVIDQAQDILVARHGCTRHEAFLDLRTAAAEHPLTVDELAQCLVADRELR
jgi:AmiR/NasT family two-component response regulator